ncbi:MAG: hypothetical protein HYY86_03240 [Candidatus Harrisonbacteria bacterium]|nr:hypothetical protein [Candidatus Harrisonbacteria bacterium]
MDNLRQVKTEYFKTLKERSKKSRVYQPHQMAGLILAEILEDPKHKSLYMKLAKKYDNNELLRLAKDLAERKNIENRGAYFMKMLKTSDIKRRG